MLAFFINNKPFMLDLGASVRLTWINPACLFDKIPGDVGMGISIPVNDNNRALLGNPERFEKLSVENDNEFPNFSILYSGVLLMGGTLVIQSASKNSYSGWLRSNVGNLGKAHREKYIYDINAFAEDKAFENKANYDPLVDPYGCPIIMNQDFFRDKGRTIKVDITVPNPDYYFGSDEDEFIPEEKDTEALTEAFRRTAQYIVNYLNPDNTVKISTSVSGGTEYEKYLDVYVVSPMLFLNYVVETLLKDANFFIDNNFITDDDELKKLIIYNNFDITNFDFTTYTSQYGQLWFDGETMRTEGAKEVEFITRNYNGTFKYKNLLPKVKLKDFILGIQNLLNVIFYFRHDGKVDIIDRESILTTAAYNINEYMLGEWEITEKKDITLKFTFDHDKDDNMFQERWEDIDDRRPDEGDPVDTWDDLFDIASPVIGEMRYIISENMYVQYAWTQLTTPDPKTGSEIQKDTLGWEHIATGFQNGYVNYGKDEEEEIATKFSSLVATQDSYTYQRGNIKSMKFAYQNFTPRLMFYHGNNRASFKTTNMALDWEKEETGLLKTRHAKWSKFWSTRQPIAGEAQLPLNVIDYMVRNLYQKYRYEKGEFLIEEMETEFSMNGIGTTKIKGFKIGYTPNIFPVESKWNVNDMIWDDALIDFTNYHLILEGFQMP